MLCKSKDNKTSCLILEVIFSIENIKKKVQEATFFIINLQPSEIIYSNIPSKLPVKQNCVYTIFRRLHLDQEKNLTQLLACMSLEGIPNLIYLFFLLKHGHPSLRLNKLEKLKIDIIIS